MGFTGFHFVWMGSDEFYLVLLGFTQFYLVFFSGLYRTLKGLTGFQKKEATQKFNFRQKTMISQDKA